MPAHGAEGCFTSLFLQRAARELSHSPFFPESSRSPPPPYTVDRTHAEHFGDVLAIWVDGDARGEREQLRAEGARKPAAPGCFR
jgi:hypothetical protein